MLYNTAALRRLLLDAFSDEEFDALCQDYFPHVYNEISRGMSRSEKIGLLLDYCQRRSEFDHLLILVEQENPAQYALYSNQLQNPAFISDPTNPFIPHRRDFYKHIPLPANFVPRPELIAEIRDVILSNHDSVALTSAIKIDTLHGMGGIGKSVLARALCDEPDIQAAFPDGIIWVTLGQTPDLQARLREVIVALGDTIRETAPTEAMLKAQLHQLLHQRYCLIVLDDVWQRTVAEAFRVVSPTARLLLTTRDAEIARGLGATVQPVPVMAPHQAILLLEQWADKSLADTNAKIKLTIVKRLGYLPLAIKLAGAQLRRKEPSQWLEQFNVTKLKSQRIETIHDDLVTTFNLSLDELDAETRHLYAALAIFMEDEAIPFMPIAKLWATLANLDMDNTEDLVDDLAARALVQLNPQEQALTLHDLLRDLMKTELNDDGLFSAHQALLHAYRQTQTGEGWSTADDDGYLYDHLVYHLDAIADHDPTAVAELKQLFGNDAWLHVRVPQSNYEYDGYIADLMTVWLQAHTACLHQIETGQPPVELVDCVRYALIRTSINSLAANYVPQLVARAVEVGLWTSERAMSVAAKIPDADKRAQVYTALLSTKNLSRSQRDSAQIFGLESISELTQDLGQESLLAKFIPFLDDFFLKPVLEIALKMKDKRALLEVLTELMPRLQKEAKQEALEHAVSATHEIEYVSTRAKLVSYLNEPIRSEILAKATEDVLARGASGMVSELTNLLPHLDLQTREMLLSRALDELQNLDGEVLYFALTDLAPHLYGQQLHQALELAYNSAFDDVRAWTLANLAQSVTGDAKRKVITESLETALMLDNEEDQAWPLIILLPQLGEEEKHEVSERALELTLKTGNFRLMIYLAPHVSKERLSPVINALLNKSNILKATNDIKDIASYLDKEQLTKVLDSALLISDELFQVDGMIEVTNQIKGNARQKVLNDTLEMVKSTKNGRREIHKVCEIASYFDEKHSAIELEKILMSVSETDIRLVLRYFSHKLDQELSLRILDLIASINDDDYRANTLIYFFRIANQALKEKITMMAYEAALTVKDNNNQVGLLIELAPYLTEEVRIEVLKKCLRLSLDILEAENRARSFTRLVKLLKGKNKEVALLEAFNAALMIEDNFEQASVLISLVHSASGDFKKEILEHIQEAISSIYEGKMRAMMLIRLLLELEQGTERNKFNILFPTLMTSDDEDFKATLLIFGDSLDAELLPNAVSVAQSFTIDKHRARALTRLAPRLEGKNKEKALLDGLKAALKVKRRETRRELLINLVPYLQGNNKEEALTEAFKASLPRNDKRSLGREKIDMLLPFLQELPDLSIQLGKYVIHHLMLIKDNKRSNVLSTLSVRSLFELNVLNLPEESWIKMAESIKDVCQKWRWL